VMIHPEVVRVGYFGSYARATGVWEATSTSSSLGERQRPT